MSKNIVIVGAGVGGQVAARGIKDMVKDAYDVFLIGPEDNHRTGLFYFNKKIPGICEREIPVVYDMISSGSFEDYQKKSRGYSDPSMGQSFFGKIGGRSKGYLLNSDKIDMKGINRVFGTVESINPLDKKVNFDDCLSLDYDYLIVTVPLMVFMRLLTPSTIIGGRDFSQEFKFSPVYTKIRGMEVPESMIDCIRVFYDMSPADESKFYRHSSYYSQGFIVKMISESIIDFEGKDQVAPLGKIKPSKVLTNFVSEIESNFMDIKICGRYARWEYHYTVDQTYEDVINFLSTPLKK